MRRGFTLIELLVIIAIMAAMVTASVLSVRSGQGAVRIKGATRDIFASIRHARSTALLSGEPVVITYSTEKTDDGHAAKIAITGAKILDTSRNIVAATLDGRTVNIGGDSSGASGGESAPSNTGDSGREGQSVEEVLFAPIAEDVVRGVKIKVLTSGEELDEAQSAAAKPRISVFSNVDYILGKFRDASSGKTEDAAAGVSSAEAAVPADDGEQSPVSIVWEANGRTEPHRVYVYADGSKPENGLCIKVDRFGAAKVLAKGEDED